MHTCKLFLCALLLFCSCAKGVRRWENRNLIPKGYDYTIPVKPTGYKAIKILYTGCGGLLIAAKDSEAILTDPFYTGQVLPTCIKIKTPNTSHVLGEMKRTGIDSKSIRNVLIAHAHYDHLHDLPYLLQQNLLNDTVRVFGSSSAGCTIGKFKNLKQQFINVDTLAYPQNPAYMRPGTWIPLSAHLRVMMIEAQHAPHVGKHIHVMTGSTCCKGIPGFANATYRSNGFKWKEGKVFAWLIDVLDDGGKPELRMFVQSSSCSPPYGFPPAAVLAERGVDVAFIGVASAQNVNNYPGVLLSYIKPQKIVLFHWEDFFRNLYSPKAKSVRATNMHGFLKGLRKHYGYNCIGDLAPRFVMPRPLTVLKVQY